METLGQTSVRTFAVMSLMSLCHIEGSPPQWQLKACSTLNFFPQVQWEGKYGSGHPYHRLMASLKAPLCRVKPCSVSGNTASQSLNHRPWPVVSWWGEILTVWLLHQPVLTAAVL